MNLIGGIRIQIIISLRRKPEPEYIDEFFMCYSCNKEVQGEHWVHDFDTEEDVCDECHYKIEFAHITEGVEEDGS